MKKCYITKYAVIAAMLISLGLATACKNNTSDANSNTSESGMTAEELQTEVPFEDVDVEIGDYKNIEVEIDTVP